MKLVSAAALAGALALSLSTAAHAAFPTFYTDAGLFNMQGSLDQSTSFGGYSSGLTLLGNSKTFGDLTLQGYPLAVVGPDFPWHPIDKLITNGDPSTLTKGIINKAGYNMLAFNMANLDGYGDQVFVQLLTNVTTYAYGLYPGPAAENLSFYGFVVPQGEYFLGFQMNRTNIDGNFQETPDDQRFGLTDIELGATPPKLCDTRVCEGGGVPEPSTWALTILGFGAAGAALRRRRAQAVC
ncbi:MAG: PEPxxWA-CTERM sorting domain-containing protein [Caulobacterales bacterium]|nr:PEPxxWA-CTERM sorting domain-containing protein [Caulobacterales bacterium]